MYNKSPRKNNHYKHYCPSVHSGFMLFLSDKLGILAELNKLREKKNTLMQEYSPSKSTIDELYKIRKNYGIYMGKVMER